jgi:hypothetical protein
MSKKDTQKSHKQDIKHQIEKTLHQVADVAQKQYQKGVYKAHKTVDKQVDRLRDRVEEFDSWAVDAVNETLENVEKKLEVKVAKPVTQKVNKAVSRLQKAARSAWDNLTG